MGLKELQRMSCEVCRKYLGYWDGTDRDFYSEDCSTHVVVCESCYPKWHEEDLQMQHDYEGVSSELQTTTIT